MSRWLGRRSWR